MDLYFSEEGDIDVDHSGDMRRTKTPWRDDIQQVYIRAMTDEGDFLIYPKLGASLSLLFGRPQSPATGAVGENLIKSALQRENRFAGSPISVKGVPTGPQSIRFDVKILSGSSQKISLSFEQELGGSA